MTVDAHVHLWRLAARAQDWIDPTSMAPIHRDHELPELAAELEAARVQGSVLVQVLNDEGETADYLDEAAASPLLLGVVGWTDLLADRIGDELDRLVERGPLVGVRHQAQAERDPGAWLECFGAGHGPAALVARGLACDLMLRPAQLDICHSVVVAHPDLRFVLDHAGKPPIASGWTSAESSAWADQVSRLGRLDQLTCKLSGLTTMADMTTWTQADLWPYVEHLLAVFGPGRLVFGSDWPVSRRAGDYARTVTTARDLVGELSADEQSAIMGGTAVQVYRLTPPGA